VGGSRMQHTVDVSQNLPHGHSTETSTVTHVRREHARTKTRKTGAISSGAAHSNPGARGQARPPTQGASRVAYQAACHCNTKAEDEEEGEGGTNANSAHTQGLASSDSEPGGGGAGKGEGEGASGGPKLRTPSHPADGRSEHRRARAARTEAASRVASRAASQGAYPGACPYT
jgi:hypothetical protein